MAIDPDKIKTIAKKTQYHIFEYQNRIYFLNYGSWRILVAGLIVTGLAVIFLGNSSVMYFMPSTDPGMQGLLLVFGLIGLVLVTAGAYLLTLWYMRTYKTPLENVERQLIFDEKKKTLFIKLHSKEMQTASAGELTSSLKMRFLDHSQGVMRDLMLNWPNGKAPIFRSNSKKELEQIQAYLSKKGIQQA